MRLNGFVYCGSQLILPASSNFSGGFSVQDVSMILSANLGISSKLKSMKIGRFSKGSLCNRSLNNSEPTIRIMKKAEIFQLWHDRIFQHPIVLWSNQSTVTSQKTTASSIPQKTTKTYAYYANIFTHFFIIVKIVSAYVTIHYDSMLPFGRCFRHLF